MVTNIPVSRRYGPYDELQLEKGRLSIIILSKLTELKMYQAHALKASIPQKYI